MRQRRIYVLTMLTTAVFVAGVYLGGAHGCGSDAMQLGTGESPSPTPVTNPVTSTADTTAPTVTSTDPANEAISVAVNTKITAAFSEALDPLTVTTASFSLSGPDATLISGSVAYADTGHSVTFTPASSLTGNTVYTATLTQAVKDVAGNPLATTFVWTFTTGTTPDTTAPTVSLTDPVNASTGITVKTKISATFSEAVDASTITTDNFGIIGPGPVPVVGTVAYDSSSNIVTFTPGSALADRSLYTATITTGVKDLAGNALATPVSWHFTTSTALTDFENFSLGDLNNQNGWTSGHGSSFCPVYDVAVVVNTFGYVSFETQSVRISNAITCGSFNDQTFSKSLVNEAGETAADTSVYSGGTRQPYFEAQWDFASTVPGSEQVGLSVVASADRGDPGRMTWLQMQDTASGLQLNFEDYQRSIANFVTTPIATGLSRTVPHTVRMTVHFVDGPSNDVVNIYLDGTLIHTGTTWEDYFRDFETGFPHPVDSILFRVAGTAAPANSGKGFLIDNFYSFSGPVPE